MNKDLLREREREASATALLLMQGWTPRGHWRFESPTGSLHDLSAADLGQLTRIEREGLFQVH